MTGIESTAPGAIKNCAWSRRAGLAGLAAVGFAIWVAPGRAVAQPTADAEPSTATVGQTVDADQGRVGDAEVAGGNAPKTLKADSSGVDKMLLVPDGESVPDIDKIIQTLDRRAPVRALAFSPDGSVIASGCEDHMVRIWHLATGRLIRRLEGHSSAVTAVAFSPDGHTIASASNDRTVRLWDARSGRPVRVLQGHVYHVLAVAFDPKGRWLATASWDRTIQLWDPRTGALVNKLRGHTAAIRSIDFSHDGQTLASGSDDQTIRLWDVSAGKELKVLTGHAGAVTAVRFRPDGQWLFSGSTDRTVRIWSLRDASLLRKLDDCGGPVLGLADSPNGQILAGACGLGGSVLWDVPTGAQLRRRGGQGIDTHAIAFSADGRMVASGSEDASIVVEDVATGRALVSLSANVAHLEAVAFAPDGKALAAVSRDRRVLVWQDAGEHKTLSRVLVGAEGALRTLAFSPDSKAIVAGGEGSTLLLWEREGEDPSPKRTNHESSINEVSFTPDGRSIVSAGEDGTVRVWDLKKDAETLVLKGHRAPVRALAVSPDGKVLASASDDETVRLWEAATGRSLGVLKSHRAPVTAVAFTPDGKFLITGSQDRTIDVWLHARGKLLKGLRKELASGVVALAPTAHGSHLISASSDGMLTLWELAGTRPLQQASAHADISSLVSSPDGVTVASASRDGVMRLWDSQTLARRWALAGSTRQRWFACNDAQICWRNEDGALLGRIDGQGDFVPVSPADTQHRTALVAVVDGVEGEISVMEGKTVSIPIRIENRGTLPAYWVSLSQTMARATERTGSLVLIPPPTITVLAPLTRTKVVCEVSALGTYENPVPHSETLHLSITSASAPPRSLEIPIRVETPYLKLRELAFAPGVGRAVVASLGEVTMAQLQPVILQGKLSLEGERASLEPITFEQALNGQDLVLAFALPDGVALDRKTRATLTVRKSTHPAHVWTFAHAPVRIPIPPWFWALLVACVLGIGLVVRRTGLHLWAFALGRIGKRWARLLLALLIGLAKTVLALILLPRTLRSLWARVQRGIVAVTFFRLQPETQCSHLARQLGARWQPLAGGREPVFELHLGGEVQLNIERCLLALPMAGEALTAVFAQLDTLAEGPDSITVVLSDVPRAALVERLHVPRRLVVFSKVAMNRVLRAPRPALVFAQVVSEQLGRAELSLYRSAVSGGPRQAFHGRKSELRRLTEPRGNHLIIGPHGIGKTSLLDEAHRRLCGHPAVVCYYLSLADGELTTALADELGMPGQPTLEELLQQLGHLSQGKKVVVLCDDADAWATRDAAQGGRELATLAGLNREGRCSFVLAGFLGLLHAAWRPDRKSFGDLIRLECLDDEACAELATEPMAALNAHYARADLVELVARESAGMPRLVVAICDQIVEGLDPAQRSIDRALVERACQSEAVARSITAWRPRFGLQEPQLATLDQTVMLSAVFKGRFTLPELQSTLASLGVQATPTEIEHSARRLVAACVFEQWLGHFHFRVPLFQRVMQEAALARVITP